MYLSHEFLNWNFGQSSGTGVDFEILSRAHEIWRHAKDRIKDSDAEFDKIDCISSLKRSINSRLKAITKEYGISDLPNQRKEKQVLEKFQDYGLIRPAFLKDLFELRNLLEHEDISPPSIEKCNHYIDIVWYFLKSTDSLLQMKIDGLSYEHEDHNEVDLDIKPDVKWKVNLIARVHNIFLSETKIDGWLEVDTKKFEPIENTDGYMILTGRLILSDKFLTSIARDYFGASGYWFQDHA